MISPNGSVSPHGLLNMQNYESNIAAFNRSYKNTGIKAGIVVKSYAYNDPANINGLSTEYDVQTIEQFENKGTTSILYKNCVSFQGFGSIADYLEFTLRSQTAQSDNAPSFNDQDGAVVVIQCLDNIGSKAIVVGSLINPSRTTNITSTSPQLSGEYNGVKIQVANDGSCSLTFNGATDNQGVPTDPSQGPTTFQIKTDGSFQFNHSTITIQADKSGLLTITATGNANLTCVDANVMASGNTNLTTTGTTTVTSKEIDLNGNLSGITTFNSHFGVVDFITGVPVQPSLTTFGDV